MQLLGLLQLQSGRLQVAVTTGTPCCGGKTYCRDCHRTGAQFPEDE